MTAWAFELSEELRSLVMMRSVTRLSHASGNVTIGKLPPVEKKAAFRYDGPMGDPDTGPVVTMPVPKNHAILQNKLKKARELFERSPFNTYAGPEKPELLIITSSACTLYAIEAARLLKAEKRIGILKLGTTWPLPPGLIKKNLLRAEKILFVEEVLPFTEENVKILAAEMAGEIGIRTFYGKNDGTIPMVGEMNPDIVVDACAKILGIEYLAMPRAYAEMARDMMNRLSPVRDLTFCPGCPHRASFWTIHNALAMDNREGFLCGDIGCYTLGFLPCGFSTMKTSHSMGSGIGIASGFGKLGQFGMDQPIMTICGDSTFFHAAIPALINAVHNRSDVIFVLLDNSGTAMTGFQPHPGTPVDATGHELPEIDPAAVCRALGATVEYADPFNIEETESTLLRLMEEGGTRVLIMKQMCALSPAKKGKKIFEVRVDESVCLGESCGCNRLCTRIFRCPGLVWNRERGVAVVDEVICAGCGVCASICPSGAIRKTEARA